MGDDRQDPGRLWAQYLKVRGELGGREGDALREAEKRVGAMRDRLVVNYSPLVKSGKKAKLESYAVSKRRWAILDELLRGQDWVPRRVRLRAQEAATGRLA